MLQFREVVVLDFLFCGSGASAYITICLGERRSTTLINLGDINYPQETGCYHPSWQLAISDQFCNLDARKVACVVMLHYMESKSTPAAFIIQANSG
jgi:hypothetical protein